ncbi:MAG: hypothetical protein AAFO08_02385, partial [Pseudomonadota bacterium]
MATTMFCQGTLCVHLPDHTSCWFAWHKGASKNRAFRPGYVVVMILSNSQAENHLVIAECFQKYDHYSPA